VHPRPINQSSKLYHEWISVSCGFSRSQIFFQKLHAFLTGCVVVSIIFFKVRNMQHYCRFCAWALSFLMISNETCSSRTAYHFVLIDCSVSYTGAKTFLLWITANASNFWNKKFCEMFVLKLLLACSIEWLIDWLVGWLVDWLIDWLVDWLIDYHWSIVKLKKNVYFWL